MTLAFIIIKRIIINHKKNMNTLIEENKQRIVYTIWERIDNGQKSVKKSSASLVFKDMQNETTCPFFPYQIDPD